MNNIIIHYIFVKLDFILIYLTIISNNYIYNRILDII